MNIQDRTERLELVERYLDGGTSLEEERLLAEFYAANSKSDLPNEEDVRRLIVALSAEMPRPEIDIEAVKEFDRRMKKANLQPLRMGIFTSLVAAILLGAVFVLRGNIEQNGTALSSKIVEATDDVNAINLIDLYYNINSLFPESVRLNIVHQNNRLVVKVVQPDNCELCFLVVPIHNGGQQYQLKPLTL